MPSRALKKCQCESMLTKMSKLLIQLTVCVCEWSSPVLWSWKESSSQIFTVCVYHSNVVTSRPHHYHRHYPHRNSTVVPGTSIQPRASLNLRCSTSNQYHHSGIVNTTTTMQPPIRDHCHRNYHMVHTTPLPLPHHYCIAAIFPLSPPLARF